MLENEWDWEFASFILPKTKYTLVRWYVISTFWVKTYTNIWWELLISDISLYEYYSVDDVLSSEDSDWVDVAWLPLLAIPVAIFVGSLAIWVVSDYYCELNDGTFYLPTTWTQNNTINFWCAISALSTIVWVVWLAWAVKVWVTRFSSKAAVEELAAQSGKNVDEVAKLWRNIWWINFSPYAYKHMMESSRYVPVSILKEVIKTVWVKDPRWTSSLMYYSKISINWKDYNIEVLYDTTANTISHFKYTAKAIGNLPKIP